MRILSVLCTVVICLSILGCATTTAPTPIVARATTVEPIRIPVIVPCLVAEQVPKPPGTWMRADKGGEYNEIAGRLDLRELEDYVVKSQSLMWGCVRSFEVEKPK